MGTVQTPTCKMQSCQEVGTLSHELIFCIKNDDVGYKLLKCLQVYIPNIDAEGVLRLDHGPMEEDLSLPVTLITAIVLSSIWKQREAGSAIQAYKVRAEIEQYINLLRTSRLQNTVTLLQDMLQNMFN